MTKKTKTHNLITEALSDIESASFNPGYLKSVTVRLSFNDYAKLKVLADKVKMSTSGLSKEFILNSLEEGINAYFGAMGNDFDPSDFNQEVDDIGTNLSIEAAEDSL